MGSSRLNIVCQDSPALGLHCLASLCLLASLSPDESFQEENGLDKVVFAAEAGPRGADSWKLPADLITHSWAAHLS